MTGPSAFMESFDTRHKQSGRDVTGISEGKIDELDPLQQLNSIFVGALDPMNVPVFVKPDSGS